MYLQIYASRKQLYVFNKLNLKSIYIYKDIKAQISLRTMLVHPTDKTHTHITHIKNINITKQYKYKINGKVSSKKKNKRKVIGN